MTKFMKKLNSLIIGVALMLAAVITCYAQNVPSEVKSEWLGFAQDMKDAGNLTVAISPSYAPDIKTADGKSDAWGAGLSLTYRIPSDTGILGHTFAGVQLDYIGSSFLSVGVAGGLKGNFQIKGQNFDIGGYGGAVKAISGSDTTGWGLMAGTYVKTTVKSWDSFAGIGPAALDVGCAVEKWERFEGQVYRVGVALSVVFK